MKRKHVSVLDKQVTRVKPSSQYCRTAAWHGFCVAVANCAARIEPSSILAVNAWHNATAVSLLWDQNRCATATRKPCCAAVRQYCELGLICLSSMSQWCSHVSCNSNMIHSYTAHRILIPTILSHFNVSDQSVCLIRGFFFKHYV